MSILVVDDSKFAQAVFDSILREAGYCEVQTVGSAAEAFLFLEKEEGSAVDLILMDIVMPEMNGIEACKRLKADERYRDLPIIIMSGHEEMEHLEAAFRAGASDFITKPANKIELCARVRSALQLKWEMDRRKAREAELLALTQQLAQLNKKLSDLSNIDGLTGIANRRSLEAFLEREWRRAVREDRPFSVIMADIDFFKSYNDTYGHQAGDDCLKAVAKALQKQVRRPVDLLARYGGEEFMAILPDTKLPGAITIAESMRLAASSLHIPHSGSAIDDHVTITVGVAGTETPNGTTSAELLAQADAALYRAKQAGRNRIETAVC